MSYLLEQAWSIALSILQANSIEVDGFTKLDLLYLHRSFFSQALTDHLKDPLDSSYGPSVIAAYHSAGTLIVLVQSLNTQLKKPSERIWFLWAHMFLCAVSSASP